MNEPRPEDSEEGHAERGPETRPETAETAAADQNAADQQAADDDGMAEAAQATEAGGAADSHASEGKQDAPRASGSAARGRPAGGGDGRGSGRRRGGGWGLLFVFLLAAAAAGGAGYLGWRLLQLEQRVATIPAERTDALQRYLRPNALQPLQSRIESLESERQALAERLGQRLDQVTETLEGLRAVTERHQIGWRLAEIRYLLTIAARRLTIAYDTEGAEAALAAADDAIAGLRDARMIPLRKAIVENLGQVRAVQPADIEGIALRLQSLLNQVDELPRAPLSTAREGGDAASGDGWLAQLRDRIDDFVVIQRRPGGPAPVVPANQRGLAPADALQLALEDARRAALARDEAAYRQALERASETLAAHFDENAGSTIRFREGLVDLAGRTVETDLPDLTDTIDLARRLAIEVENARRAATLESDEDQPAAAPQAED